MAHEFEYRHANRLREVRRCWRCGKRQELHRIRKDGKVIKRQWLPLIGRCPGDSGVFSRKKRP